MIARTWRGATRAADSATYAAYIEATGLRAFGDTPGNLGAFVLQRPLEGSEDGITEVVVISLWDSMEAVARFAGPDVAHAVFYPEDDRYLVRRDVTVDHYDVVAQLGVALPTRVG